MKVCLSILVCLSVLSKSVAATNSGLRSKLPSTSNGQQEDGVQVEKHGVVVKKAEKESADSDLLVKTRIVGGKPVTDKNKYPFYGFPAGTNNCGATLVHPDMMVTAAACSSFFNDGVVIGGTTIDGTNGTFHQVVGEYVHPLFNATTFLHNIMLIKLARPSRAPLVQLNDSPEDPGETEGVEILGYGALNETGSTYSPTLMMAKVLVAPPARCALYSNFDKTSMMCSWFPHGGRDACKGDTGGPVLMKATQLQVGILSFGKGCGREEYPASNTRVSYYHDFIHKSICEHSSTPPKKCL